MCALFRFLRETCGTIPQTRRINRSYSLALAFERESLRFEMDPCGRRTCRRHDARTSGTLRLALLVAIATRTGTTSKKAISSPITIERTLVPLFVHVMLTSLFSRQERAAPAKHGQTQVWPWLLLGTREKVQLSVPARAKHMRTTLARRSNANKRKEVDSRGRKSTLGGGNRLSHEAKNDSRGRKSTLARSSKHTCLSKHLAQHALSTAHDQSLYTNIIVPMRPTAFS